MGFFRKAGDIFSTGNGKKTSATIGTLNSGFDIIGTARAVGSELHPTLGLLDDAAGLVETAVNPGQGVASTFINGTGAVGGAGNLIGIKAPALGARIGQAGPLAGALGIGANLGDWMTNNLDQNVSSSGRGSGRNSFRGN